MSRFGVILASALLCLTPGGADAARPARNPALPVPPLPPRARPAAARDARALPRRIAAARPLPVPPLPPDLQLGPAPVPDAEVHQPAPAGGGASAAPALFHLPGDFGGDGYPYGASPQGVNGQREAGVPGMRLTLPLP